MSSPAKDTFWDDCDLTSRNPGVVSGAAVLEGTRLPADTLIGNVEAYMELQGQTLDEAIASTLDDFPTPGGDKTIRALLAYCDKKQNRKAAA